MLVTLVRGSSDIQISISKLLTNAFLLSKADHP